MANTKQKSILDCGVFTGKYWSEAAKELTSVKSLVFAALIIALRVAVKAFKIPVAAGVNFTLDCYVNAMGSVVYGPVVGLLVGAASDTLGCILFPSGTYFLPFILVEMWSSFIFGLLLWRRQITVPRVLISKFLINFVGNIAMNSVFMKWMYYALGDDKFYTYNIVNGVRVVKNLVLFPLEAILIVLLLTAVLPAMRSLKIVPKEQQALRLRKKDIVLVVTLFVLSVALVLSYVFWLKDIINPPKPVEEPAAVTETVTQEATAETLEVQTAETLETATEAALEESTIITTETTNSGT